MKLVQLISKKLAIEKSTNTLTVGFNSDNYTSRCKSFDFPKNICINSTLAEAIGLILGDGDMHRKEKAHLTFCSKDIDIAVFVIGFFRSHLLLQKIGSVTKLPYSKETAKLLT